jgi:predicted AlkP superfamily phosphohydrolase/phosphomutase
MTELGRPVLVLGWWASWPVDEIQGLMISDRVFRPEHERAVWPAELEEKISGWAEASRRAYGDLYSTEWYGRYDALMAWVAGRELGASRYDLSLVYFHSTDVVSHRYWKFVEPERFPPSTESERAEHGQKVYDAYRAVDRSLAQVLAAAGEEARVLLVSDHGFEATKEETIEVGWRAAPVLEAAGFWKGKGDAPDWTATRAYDHRSKRVDSRKRIRINVKGREPEGIVPPEQLPAMVEALAASLSRFHFRSSGKPAFRVEKPGPEEDADLIVDVLRKRVEDLDTHLLYEGRVIAGIFDEPRFVSGEHKGEPPGILVAAGPGIRKGAWLEKASVFEIAPTVLYMLGLPYGEDMAGRPLLEIFTEEHLAKHPPQAIPTYERSPWRPAERPPSPADEETLERLRALGYIP